MNQFNLDETSLSILKDIFDRSLVDGSFVVAEDYRVAKNELRPLMDKLELRWHRPGFPDTTLSLV